MGMGWLLRSGAPPGRLGNVAPGEPEGSESSVASPPVAEENDSADSGVAGLCLEGRRVALRSLLRPAMAMYRPCRVYFAIIAGSFQLP